MFYLFCVEFDVFLVFLMVNSGVLGDVASIMKYVILGFDFNKSITNSWILYFKLFAFFTKFRLELSETVNS